MIETPLGKALRAHRESCLHCQEDAARPVFNDHLSCPVYRGIAQQATAERQRWAGPTAQFTWLSIQEAVNV